MSMTKVMPRARKPPSLAALRATFISESKARKFLLAKAMPEKMSSSRSAAIVLLEPNQL